MFLVMSHHPNSRLLLNPLYHTEAVKTTWFTLLILGGQILLPILTITMLLSKKIRHDGTLINIFITWSLFSFIMCLLLYSGHQSSTEPPFGLCLTQAALVHASPTMVTTALLSTVVQAFLCLRDSTPSGNITDDARFLKLRRYRTIALVILPYAVFIIFAIVSAVIGSQAPAQVSRSRSFLYCSIQSDINIITIAYSAFIAMAVIGFEAYILATYYRQWAANTLQTSYVFFDTPLIIQILLYSLLSCVGWATHLIGTNSFTVLPWVFTAATPVALFIIFAARLSILTAWFGWAREILLHHPDNKRQRYTHYACQVSVSRSIYSTHQPHLPPQAHQRRESYPDDLNSINTLQLSISESPLSDGIFSLAPSSSDRHIDLDKISEWRTPHHGYAWREY